MPSQNESAFQSSSTPPPYLPSSSTLYPGDRNPRPADSSSCTGPRSLHPQPVENLSFQVSYRPAREDMSSNEEESYPSAPSDRANTVEQLVESGPQSSNAISEVTAADPNEALSALMAIPHYTNSTSNHPNISVPEVVNAVTERSEIFRHGHISSQGVSGHHSTPPSELYMSDSEMTDAISDMGGVSIGSYHHGQIGIAGLINQFIGIAPRNNLSSVFEDTEDDSATDLGVEHDPLVETHSALRTPDGDLDDTRKFYFDTSDHEYEASASHQPQIYQGVSHLSDIDYDDFYQGPERTHDFQDTGFGAPLSHEDLGNFFTEGEDMNGEDFPTENHFNDPVVHGTTQERNFNIDQFISQLLYHSSAASIPMISLASSILPHNPIPNILRWTPPARITRPQRYTGDLYDLQQIPWWDKLRVKRTDARHLRDQWYTSYHNLEYSRQRLGTRLLEEEFYFQGKSMYTECKATIEHFQLRNLMSVPAYNTVHFAHESKLFSWAPAYDELKCLIDLSKPSVESGFQGPVKISTMKSAYSASIAGGFFGEYALRAAGTQERGVEGFVTKDSNGITNHIDIILSRTNRSPLGIFASNDRHLRTLDCETNTFVSDHELPHAINCTSTSLDGRLRVIIGDSPDAWVIEAETGRPVHPLRGHRDFGFACAWSPDMRQIATSNQDKTAIIWDARMWRILEKIESDVAGYRSLRFSPVGGGPRTLLLCEPADRIVIVNAQTYRTRQVHDFFGEIGGADYSPEGSNIWVANTDEHFGGFMEYDRRQWGQPYGLNHRPNEWVPESALDEDERCLLSERERQMRFWWNLNDEEHEDLLI